MFIEGIIVPLSYPLCLVLTSGLFCTCSQTNILQAFLVFPVCVTRHAHFSPMCYTPRPFPHLCVTRHAHFSPMCYTPRPFPHLCVTSHAHFHPMCYTPRTFPPLCVTRHAHFHTMCYPPRPFPPLCYKPRPFPPMCYTPRPFYRRYFCLALFLYFFTLSFSDILLRHSHCSFSRDDIQCSVCLRNCFVCSAV
jgi:hypothetical protein